jgi:hypothetical protein
MRWAGRDRQNSLIIQVDLCNHQHVFVPFSLPDGADNSLGSTTQRCIVTIINILPCAGGGGVLKYTAGVHLLASSQIWIQSGVAIVICGILPTVDE